MGLFKKLIKGAVDTALLPTDIVRDIILPDADMGARTTERLAKLVEDAEKAYEELEDDS